MKTCPDCGQTKQLELFAASTKNRDGRGTYCKECMLERSRASYRKRRAAQGRTVREREALPPDHKRCPDCGRVKAADEFPNNRLRADGRATYCKPCHNARGKESKGRLHGGSSYYHRRARYGLDVGEVDEMVLDQGDVCAICREGAPEHVDHDHATGRVRGMLCFNCNGLLGQARDRVDILLEAINYLDRSRGERWQSILVRWDVSLPRTPERAAASPTS